MCTVMQPFRNASLPPPSCILEKFEVLFLIDRERNTLVLYLVMPDTDSLTFSGGFSHVSALILHKLAFRNGCAK